MRSRWSYKNEGFLWIWILFLPYPNHLILLKHCRGKWKWVGGKKRMGIYSTRWGGEYMECKVSNKMRIILCQKWERGKSFYEVGLIEREALKWSKNIKVKRNGNVKKDLHRFNNYSLILRRIMRDEAILTDTRKITQNQWHIQNRSINIRWK